MGMALGEMVQRVKAEGKDSLGLHQSRIEDFIRDICRELTTTFNFFWLTSITTITTTGTWQDLDKDVLKIIGVTISNQTVRPISEEEYFKAVANISPSYSGDLAYYRIQWDSSTKRKEINFVNVDTGTSVTLLVRKYYDAPDKLPPEFEEVIVQGALFKLTAFLEGDDSTTSGKHEKRYRELANQMYYLADEELQNEGDYDRVKTADEMEILRSTPYYKDAG